MIGVGGNADKDAHVRASAFGKARSQAASRVSSVFDGSPHRFQEQTLLAIDQFRFPTGNLDEVWVELVILVKETAPFAVDFSVRRGLRIRMIDAPIVPSF